MKICLISAILLNDIEEQNKNNKNKTFCHQSLEGKLILEVFINTCGFYSKSISRYFEDIRLDTNCNYSYLQFYSCFISLYTTDDNFYDSQLHTPPYESNKSFDIDFKQFTTQSIHKVYVIEPYFTRDEVQNQSLISTLFNIKAQLESSYMLFFNNKIKLNDLIFEVGNGIDLIFLKIEEIKGSNKIDTINHLFYSEIMEDNKLSEFLEYDYIIKSLMLSSIDITLTKLLLIDLKLFRLDHLQIKKIFFFLLIFLIDKQGVEYLLLGRNLRRIIKLFEVYPIDCIKFSYFLFEAINFHGVSKNVSYHKRIQPLLNLINTFFTSSSYKNYTSNKDDTVKLHSYGLRILNYIGSYLSINLLVKA